MKLHVEFVGSVYAKSGYGWAARNYFKSLLTQPERLEVTLNPMRWGEFDEDVASHEFAEYVKPAPASTKVRIFHGNPASKREVMERYAGVPANGQRMALFTVWETDVLPAQCVAILNEYDAVIVPTRWNRDSFIRSGVNAPIYVVPHAYDPADYAVSTEIETWQGDERYTFYWLGAWVERKNPIGVLRAFLHAFPSANFPVRLIMKTGGVSIEGITADIDACVRNMNLKSAPPILPISEVWSDDQIRQMHNDCQCYVSLARGEGWDVPLFEANLYGNQAIYSDYGGHAWAKYSGGYAVPCQEAPAFGDPGSSLYDGTMRWAEPNLVHAAGAMRVCASHRSPKSVTSNTNKLRMFDLQHVGKGFRETLEAIAEGEKSK